LKTNVGHYHEKLQRDRKSTDRRSADRRSTDSRRSTDRSDRKKSKYSDGRKSRPVSTASSPSRRSGEYSTIYSLQ
jgi:hypothetical protein